MRASSPAAPTASPRSSDRRVAADRANARKSTGPRTPAGKAPITRLAASPFTFAGRLKDWVCEPIAWGEQRIACYLIPRDGLRPRTRRSPIPAPCVTVIAANTGRLLTALEQMGAFRCDELSPVAGPA